MFFFTASIRSWLLCWSWLLIILSACWLPRCSTWWLYRWSTSFIIIWILSLTWPLRLSWWRLFFWFSLFRSWKFIFSFTSAITHTLLYRVISCLRCTLITRRLSACFIIAWTFYCISTSLRWSWLLLIFTFSFLWSWKLIFIFSLLLIINHLWN